MLSLIATPEYFSAYYLIFFIIPAFSFIGLKTIAQSLLNIQNKTYITGAIVISHSLLGIGLHYFFVLHFGLYGIIFVFNFVSFLITFSLMHFGLKEYPISLEIKRIAAVAVIFISMLSAIYFLSAFSAIIYYITIPLLIFTVFIILYYGNFFTVQEKDYIKTVFRKKSLHLNI
jgi:O-antigen/teichoic acid export membrane protein